MTLRAYVVASASSSVRAGSMSVPGLSRPTIDNQPPPVSGADPIHLAGVAWHSRPHDRLHHHGGNAEVAHDPSSGPVKPAGVTPTIVKM